MGLCSSEAKRYLIYLLGMVLNDLRGQCQGPRWLPRDKILPCLVLHKPFPSCRILHLCQVLPQLGWSSSQRCSGQEKSQLHQEPQSSNRPGSLKPSRTQPCCPRGLLPAQPSSPAVAPGEFSALPGTAGEVKSSTRVAGLGTGV